MLWDGVWEVYESEPEVTGRTRGPSEPDPPNKYGVDVHTLASIFKLQASSFKSESSRVSYPRFELRSGETSAGDEVDSEYESVVDNSGYCQ